MGFVAASLAILTLSSSEEVSKQKCLEEWANVSSLQRL